eukprot:CAMPEP_0184050262 /NCGR_PEP_ID=MMETSP0956-20121227/3947_1 /TAXON_ID=627963 /ORGANISM="Aplanochytrium sp, Strain PBS07" /LENGTH=207 /DNA_ID=CAMNT_0026342803 /DNA_START=783 /DNA_END=1406 /DNA_ORIENTATION=+
MIVDDCEVNAQLRWHHPFSLSGKPNPYQHELYQKRARFVSLFSLSWQHLLKKTIPMLTAEGLNAEEESGLDNISVEVLHTNCPSALNLKSALKTSSRNITRKTKVQFSDEKIVRQVPLTKDAREARMGAGMCVSLPGGQLRPLRSPKTGLYINSNILSVKSGNKQKLETVDAEDSRGTGIKQPAGEIANVREKTLIRRDSPKRYRIE